MQRIHNIDELRAVFFLSVLLFHLWPDYFTHGFLGVDLFFVLSGYLMQKIGSQCQTFTQHVIFIQNRIVRIYLPKLFIVVLTLPTAFIFFPPDTLENFGQSLIAALLGLENLFFYLKTDYWATANIEKPLLHYWSLGVEVQFYILFTIVCYLKLSNVYTWLVLSLLGLAFNQVLHNDASLSFYMLTGRLHLFTFGIALASGGPRIKFLAILAMILCVMAESITMALVYIFVSIAIYILPNQNLLKVLLNKIGKRSFSYYLVHWVIISVFWIVNQTPVTILNALAIMLITAVIGEISYRFVEIKLYREVLKR